MVRMGLAMNAADAANEAIRAAINEVNRQRSADQPLAATADTALVGPEASLDSLGLITLIVAVEQKFEELSGLSVSLTDLVIDTSDASALNTIGSLTGYLIKQLEEQADA